MLEQHHRQVLTYTSDKEFDICCSQPAMVPVCAFSREETQLQQLLQLLSMGKGNKPAASSQRDVHGILLWIWRHWSSTSTLGGSVQRGLNSGMHSSALAGLPGCESSPSTFTGQILTTEPCRSKLLLYGARSDMAALDAISSCTIRNSEGHSECGFAESQLRTRKGFPLMFCPDLAKSRLTVHFCTGLQFPEGLIDPGWMLLEREESALVQRCT